MVRVKRVGVLSVAILQAVFMAIFGLIIGIFIAIFGTAMTALSADKAVGTPIFVGLGFFAVILFPIIYGAMGFVLGVICAALYNLVAGWVGGVEMDLEK